MMLTEGELAPDFVLDSQRGRKVRLSEFLGKPVVLYFYPRDDTSGCTTEACSFRDQFPAFEEIDACVFGLSPDDVASHGRFAEKFSLPFELLADVDHSVASAYGAWGEKSMYGRTFEGILRSTFVVGPDGRIAKVFAKVKPQNHAAEVLEALVRFSAGP